MRLHASCVAREGRGVLLVGPSGAGKSDLAVRLLDRGCVLVADDQVEVDGLSASPPPALAGLLEVRGIGIMQVAHLASAPLLLAVACWRGERLPGPLRYGIVDLPMICVDPFAASAPLLVELAMDNLLGRVSFVTGAIG